MSTVQDAPVADKDKRINIKFDLNEALEGSPGNGFDALGKVFGGLVGAIKDAIGPELMKTIGTANWLAQVAKCLETMSHGLATDGTVPDEPAGEFAFLADQLDVSVDGSKLETQKATFREHLQKSQQALENADADPQTAAKTLARAAGYFKAAATSIVPVQAKSESDHPGE